MVIQSLIDGLKTKKSEEEKHDLFSLQLEMMQVVKQIHLNTLDIQNRFVTLEEKISKYEKTYNDSNEAKEKRNMEGEVKEDNETKICTKNVHDVIKSTSEPDSEFLRMNSSFADNSASSGLRNFQVSFAGNIPPSLRNSQLSFSRMNSSFAGNRPHNLRNSQSSFSMMNSSFADNSAHDLRNSQLSVSGIHDLRNNIDLDKTTRRKSIMLGQNKHELNLFRSSGFCLKEEIQFESLRDLNSFNNPIKPPCTSDVEKEVFTKFCILSILPNSLSENKCISSTGSNFLDPLYYNSTDVIEEFSFSTNHDISSKQFSPFCFPNGIQLRLIPRCVLKKAKNLGWVGEGGDTYQIHVFTNAYGQKCHGLSISIRQELNNVNMQKIILIRKQRRAIRVISHFWLRYLNMKDSIISTDSNKFFAFKRTTSIFQTLMSSIESRHSSRTATFFDEFNEKDINIMLQSQSSIITSPEDDDKYQRVKKKYISKKARLQAIESYQTMLENERIGQVCIVEKCYILTGIDSKHHSLLFLALQQLIDLERLGKQPVPRRVMLEELESFRKSLHLSPMQSKIDYPESELQHLNQKKKFFQPGCSFAGLKIPLPLPQIISEWGVAVLILRFKISNLIKILKMLLLERSVLIIGNNPGEVSVCSCALLELLKPYKWASVFIPVLPGDALDFVDSPVPFVAGATYEDKSIYFDSRVRQAMMSGLSVMNLVTAEVHFTKEAGMQNTLLQSDTIIHTLVDYEKLDSYQIRLNYLAQEDTSCLNNLRLFFQHGPSSKESLTLKSIKRVIFSYLINISAGISDSWEKYGVQETQTNQFQFFPDLFIEPLLYQLEFQKIMVDTQLFVGYIEEKHERRSAIHSASTEDDALFIANWLYQKWNTRKLC